MIKEIRGGITAPLGFLAGGVHVGIKQAPLLDLALVVSEKGGPVAGVFTNNDVAAAPVQVDRQHLRRGKGRAILINSGNANACTGSEGLAHALELASVVAQHLMAPRHTVFLGSTGVIGQALPIKKIRRGMPLLFRRLRRGGGTEAARAILTTDTTIKQASVQARIAGCTVTVGGMAKGSGMIHPDMATMLAYLSTDVAIAQPALRKAMRTAVEKSFNCISVDGDTSTNDTVLCLANGMAGNPLLRNRSMEFPLFQRMLDRVCTSLAMQVCRDGEGGTKVVRVIVEGARTEADAKQVARTVGTSSLVKTAFFGEDANWGRIMAAVGRSGVFVRQNRISLAFDGKPMVKQGVGLGRKAEREVSRVVRRKEFTLTVHLGMGNATASLWTTDLSYDYVKINASYRS